MGPSSGLAREPRSGIGSAARPASFASCFLPCCESWRGAESDPGAAVAGIRIEEVATTASGQVPGKVSSAA